MIDPMHEDKYTREINEILKVYEVHTKNELYEVLVETGEVKSLILDIKDYMNWDRLTAISFGKRLFIECMKFVRPHVQENKIRTEWIEKIY